MVAENTQVQIAWSGITSAIQPAHDTSDDEKASKWHIIGKEKTRTTKA